MRGPMLRSRNGFQSKKHLNAATGFVAQIGWWDSLYESSVVAGENEQLDTDDLQDQELVRLQPSPKAAWFAVDLV
jgi:hypothetical protein